jgi:hypothetical protein
MLRDREATRSQNSRQTSSNRKTIGGLTRSRKLRLERVRGKTKPKRGRQPEVIEPEIDDRQQAE